MKGQISLEAIMILGVAIIVLTSLVNINWERYYTAREIGEAGEAKMVGELLATAINTAYANGEGFRIYLGYDKLNYTKMGSTEMGGMGINLPLIIDTVGRTINISKNMSKIGGGAWNTTVPIIPMNITQDSPTQYPETTIQNNGTHIIVYANESNIKVV